MLAFRTRLINLFTPVLHTSLGKKLIVWILLHMNFVLPIDRLFETETLIAFFHPQPAYSFHVLLIPRIDIPDLLSLDDQQPVFLQDVFKTAQQIVKDYHLEQHGYRLILNGGPNQEFPILHFHLIAEINPINVKGT